MRKLCRFFILNSDGKVENVVQEHFKVGYLSLPYQITFESSAPLSARPKSKQSNLDLIAFSKKNNNYLQNLLTV